MEKNTLGKVPRNLKKTCVFKPENPKIFCGGEPPRPPFCVRHWLVLSDWTVLAVFDSAVLDLDSTGLNSLDRSWLEDEPATT